MTDRQECAYTPSRADDRLATVYIEPWAPQLTLQSLADTVTRARSAGQGKPVVLAAYQHVYDTASAAESDRATALTMAMLYSHGATQILAGEADRLLVDPYYVRNHVMEESTKDLLKRWYDFLVAHDEVLMPASLTEVTHSYAGDYNGEIDVLFDAAEISVTAEAGKVWRRIVRDQNRIVVHLINLCGQSDTLWDAPRQPSRSPGRGRLSLRPLLGRTPRVRAADPDVTGKLEQLTIAEDGEHVIVDLPDLAVWQIVVVDL